MAAAGLFGTNILGTAGGWILGCTSSMSKSSSGGLGQVDVKKPLK
jgi:hypothetical protein